MHICMKADGVAAVVTSSFLDERRAWVERDAMRVDSCARALIELFNITGSMLS